MYEAVSLRALEPSDLPFLYQWENDAAVWADSDTHNPLSQHALRDYIVSSSSDIYKDGQLRLVIECRDIITNEVITAGCADLFDFDPRTGRAAIGLYIMPQLRGSGVAHQALKQLENYAFSFLGLHMIYAVIGTDNAPCVTLFEESGYCAVGPLRQWIRRQGQNYADAFVFQKTAK